MDKWAERAYRVITARSPRTEAGTLAQRVIEAEKQYGSQRAAARALGIPRATLGRWRSGAVRAPKNAAADAALTAAVRRGRLRASESAVRGRIPPIEVDTEITISEDERPRTVVLSTGRGDTLTDYAQVGDWSAVVDAYLTGGDIAAAVDTLVRTGLEVWVPGARVGPIYDVRIGKAARHDTRHGMSKTLR